MLFSQYFKRPKKYQLQRRIGHKGYKAVASSDKNQFYEVSFLFSFLFFFLFFSVSFFFLVLVLKRFTEKLSLQVHEDYLI